MTNAAPANKRRADEAASRFVRFCLLMDQGSTRDEAGHAVGIDGESTRRTYERRWRAARAAFPSLQAPSPGIPRTAPADTGAPSPEGATSSARPPGEPVRDACADAPASPPDAVFPRAAAGEAGVQAPAGAVAAGSAVPAGSAPLAAAVEEQAPRTGEPLEPLPAPPPGSLPSGLRRLLTALWRAYWDHP